MRIAYSFVLLAMPGTQPVANRLQPQLSRNFHPTVNPACTIRKNDDALFFGQVGIVAECSDRSRFALAMRVSMEALWGADE